MRPQHQPKINPFAPSWRRITNPSSQKRPFGPCSNIPSTSNGNGANGNGHLLVPSGPHKDKNLTWLLANDRAYLEKIATSAQDEALRKAACALLS